MNQLETWRKPGLNPSALDNTNAAANGRVRFHELRSYREVRYLEFTRPLQLSIFGFPQEFCWVIPVFAHFASREQPRQNRGFRLMNPFGVFKLKPLLLFTVLGLSFTGCQKKDSAATTPTFTSKELSKDEEQRELNTRLERIEKILDHTLNQRRLNTRDHAAWQIVHALLAFGKDLQIEHNGQLVPALQWLLDGNALTGWNLRPGDRGVVVPVEVGSKTGQGHPDQWLGYLSQTGLDPQTKIKVAGKDYTIHDLLTQAQWDLTPGMEATWTLMALGTPTYWKLNDSWQSRNGETWTVERLAGMEGNEVKSPIVGGSCGGTHRLYALAMAVNQKMLQDKVSPIN